MQLKVLCLLPRSTYLPSSWICCDWQTLAVPKCTEGFVWHFVAWDTLALTTLVGKLRALEWLLRSWVFPNSSLWQLSGWAVINRFYWCVPWGHLDNSRKSSFMWALSYSFKTSSFLICLSQRPQALEAPWRWMCLLKLKEAGVMVWVTHRTLSDTQTKPIRSALQMCLFGSHGVSFLNIKIRCQAAKTADFYFEKPGYMTCLEKIGAVWPCWGSIFLHWPP